MFCIVGAVFLCGAWVQSQRGHVGIEAIAEHPAAARQPHPHGRRRHHVARVLRVLRVEVLDAVPRGLGRQDDDVVDVLAAAHDSLRPDGRRHDAARRCSSCCRSSARFACRRRRGRPMSVLALGPAVRRRHAGRDVLRHADRLRAGLRRDPLHGAVHAGVLARHRDAERLRGDGEHHAAVDPALHPEGRGDRPIRRRPRPVSRDARVDAAHPRRPRHRQRVHLRAVRRDGRLEPGDVLGHRQRRHSGDAQARLLAGLRRGHHRRRRHARHPAAAVDHDDPLRGRGRGLARPAVPRRHRSRAAAGRAVLALRHVPVPQGVRGRARRVRARRHALRVPRREGLHAARKGRDAPARAAVRDPADRRDGRALRRLCDAVGNGRPRRGARARADRAHLPRLAPGDSEADPRGDASRNRRC